MITETLNASISASHELYHHLGQKYVSADIILESLVKVLENPELQDECVSVIMTEHWKRNHHKYKNNWD